jgi:hypothetical protein
MDRKFAHSPQGQIVRRWGDGADRDSESSMYPLRATGRCATRDMTVVFWQVM